MKIVTWNINGIRASNREIPLKKLLDSLEADVICLQETKVTRVQLDEATAIVDGYNAFFSFSKAKGGYSGVATYCRTPCTPRAVEEGLTGLLTEDLNKTAIGCYNNEGLSLTKQELLKLDGEGRAILSEHDIVGGKPLVIVNLYCPRACRDNDERWTYKQNFYKLVQARCEALLSCHRSVMIVGDFNVSHTKLDHCEPDADPEYFASNESRIWMSEFLLPLSKLDMSDEGSCSQLASEQTSTCDVSQLPSADGTGDESAVYSSLSESSNSSGKRKAFVDLFRYFFPSRENAFTCWSTVTGARKTNYGTRIDYVLVNQGFLTKYALSCDIRPDIHGSDHCPVAASFSCEIQNSANVPDLCSVFMPEFKGKQKSIRAFFSVGSSETSLLPQKYGLNANGSIFATKSIYKDGSQEAKENGVVVKRKAGKEITKNPAKIQRKGSFDKKCGQKARSNILSFFQKPHGISITAKNTTLANFLKDAQITDVKLQDEILRDCVVSSAEQDLYSSRDCQSHLQDTSNQSSSSSEGQQDNEDASKGETAIEETLQPSNSQEEEETSGKTERSRLKWKSILKGPDPPPLCEGHKEECVLRTVKKLGPNLGKQFYCCARPDGRASDKEARCKTFIWKKK